jgi:peptidyl-prolyl cis-trans isomerase C
LGYFTKDAMVKSFADAAFAMNKGDLSSTPVKTQFGFHVIKVEDKRTASAPAFEKVREALASNERRKILDELVKQWNAGAKIERFDVNGKPLPAPKAEEAPAAAPVEPQAPAATTSPAQ